MKEREEIFKKGDWKLGTRHMLKDEIEEKLEAELQKMKRALIATHQKFCSQWVEQQTDRERRKKVRAERRKDPNYDPFEEEEDPEDEDLSSDSSGRGTEAYYREKKELNLLDDMRKTLPWYEALRTVRK